MSRILFLTSVFIVFSGVFLSCRKKKNDNPFGNVRIQTVDYTQSNATIHYSIAYDSYNNVDSIIGTGNGVLYYKNFDYRGAVYIVTDQSTNMVNVQTDANGLIVKISAPADSVSFIYKGIQLAERDDKVPSTAFPYYTKTSTFYTWANGDMTGSGTQIYDYDGGKAGQPGDAIRIMQFLAYGRSYVKTSHLPVDLRNSAKDTVEKYFYQFDGQGRISHFTRLKKLSGTVYDTTTLVYGY